MTATQQTQALLQRLIRDVDDLKRPVPPTIITDGITAASGWLVVDWSFQRRGGIGAIWIRVERAGGTITVSSSGNITNTPVATLPPECRGPSTLEWGLPCGPAGRVAAATYVPSSGVVSLTAVAPADSIVNGERLSFAGPVWLT